MRTVGVYLRRIYINTAARVFYVNKLKKVNRIAKYQRVFKKNTKKYSLIWCSKWNTI